MKKLIPTLTLTALTLSGLAQASEYKLQFSQSETPYRTLQKAFAEGEDATMEELEGYHAGRCFETWAQDKPLNSMLVSHLLTSQAGPLFPAEELLFVFESSYGPSYFDSYDVRDRNVSYNIHNIRQWLESDEHDIDTSSGTPEFYTDYEPNDRMDERSTFRWVGDYIVSQKVNLISNNIIQTRSVMAKFEDQWGSERHRLKKIRGVAAGPIEYCYYFKTLEAPTDEE